MAMSETTPANLQSEANNTTRRTIVPENASMSQDIVDKPCGCGAMSENTSQESMRQSYVYSIGRIGFRFPNKSLEKELAQVIGRGNAKELTDHQAIHSILSQRQNRYLVRQLCWVMIVGGIETYILRPSDSSDLDLLIESLRPEPKPTDLDVVIGRKGPLASPQVCNGLMVPIVAIDQIYSFDFESLIKAIPRPEKTPAKQFTATAEELLDRVMQLADNAGATDEHRALNYLAVRYPVLYQNVVECHSKNCSLTAIDVVPSRLSGVRRILDVILSHTNRSTDVVEKHYVRVDVTEEFPYLVSKMSPYFDR